MATLEDVRTIASEMPEVTEGPVYSAIGWRVRDRLFVWERPLGQKDRDELGAGAPSGPVLGLRVRDEGVKRALIADDPSVFFTTSHFDGYAAVLVRLDVVGSAVLKELVVDAWLDRAPKRVAAAYLAGR